MAGKGDSVGDRVLSVNELRESLQEITTTSSADWIQRLGTRKLQELEFHDGYRDPQIKSELGQDGYDKVNSNRKFYTTVRKSTDYCDRWLSTHSPGKVFLDYACGDGINAIKAAKAGASLAIGLDISEVSVGNARAAAQREGLDNAIFLQADAEDTRLPNSCVEVAICSGMLHHLDLSYAFPELRRILAPGGRILAIEALNYNPVIQLYRRRTPNLRTAWEKDHILDLSDVRFARRFFELGEVRYWHIVSYAAAYARPLLGILESIDSALTRVPLVKLMAWMFTFELLSKDE